MPREYPEEFRQEAVRLVRSSKEPINKIAKELGVHAQTLANWVNLDAVEAGERAGMTKAERAELTRLRRENRLLKEEREILKKAAAFFAREGDSRR
jgi:transposase